MLEFWEKFQAFLAEHLGTQRSQPNQASPLHHLLDPLEHLRQEALRLRETQDQARARGLEEERQESLVHQAFMREDILALHKQLETGFGLDQLEQLSLALKQHCHDFRSQASDQLIQMAMLAVEARFHQEALAWAWDQFEKVRQSHGVEWPVPGGLSPNADAEEVAEHCRLHLKMAHEQFLAGTLMVVSDLILGVVPAWRSLYPERGGAVWQQTVFEAVAGAMAAARWQKIEKLAAEHHAALEERIAGALGAELAGIQQRLARGVSSVAEARSLSDEAIERCQKVAPQVVWEYLAPLLP